MNEAKAMEEMKRLKGTQTEKNLAAAFAGESQAHVKYTLFARQAEKDSAMSRQIADILDETAAQERAHAKIWFWLLGDFSKPTAEHLKWPPTVKTKNGPPCIRNSQKPRRKKALKKLPSCLNG